MKQLPFEWIDVCDEDEKREDLFPQESRDAAVALMARLLIAVIRSGKEEGDGH